MIKILDSTVRYALNVIGVTEIDPALPAEVLKTIKQVGKRGRCVDLHELAVIVKCCEDKQAYPV